MQLQSFEIGVQRLYYVAWLLFTSIMCAIGGSMVLYEGIGDINVALAFLYVVAIFVGPWVAMILIRWVYRGFIPKVQQG